MGDDGRDDGSHVVEKECRAIGVASTILDESWKLMEHDEWMSGLVEWSWKSCEIITQSSYKLRSLEIYWTLTLSLLSLSIDLKKYIDIYIYIHK